MKPTVMLLVFTTAFAIGQEKQPRSSRSSPSSKQTSVLININRIAGWYEMNGQQERDPVTGNAGVTYPRGTSTAIYAGGILWGGLVHDGVTPELRVNGQSYSVGTVQGAILGIRTGNTEDASNTDVRIWRVRRDFATADLKKDAAETLVKAIGNTDTNDIALVREQYLKDWLEWPAHKGAPFYDADGDGKYTPKFTTVNDKQVPILYPDADEPGLQDADQVVWYVANDIAGSSPWSSPDIGLEMQTTLWGYNYPSNHGLGNAIFKRVRLIYKGTASTPADATIDSFYIAQWSDPDLGDAGDDFVGCDSVFGIGYVYNSITRDKEYSKFDISAPAFGYILLQGPLKQRTENEAARFDFSWKQGFANVPATSFIYFAAGAPDPGPPFPPTSRCYYNILRGLPPTPVGPPDPAPLKNPVTGKPSHFWLDGDPVTRSGWLDGVEDPSGDRRFFLSSGPFNMSIGDTQEVIYALVGGVGSDRLASITVMKYFARQVKNYFDFSFPDNPMDVERQDVAHLMSYSLSQNYPNPFNPTTTIEYEIPKDGFVTLKVYDMLGREAAVLVNEQKSSGKYSVDWNAAGLTSGVYYFQLRAGSFSQSRKMMLVK